MKTAGVIHGEEQRIPEAGAPAREIVVQADGGSAACDESALKALLLDAVSDSVIVHDLEGCIIYANRAARDLRGYTQEEFLRLNLRDILGGDTESALEKRMAGLTATGRHETESSSRRKDGSEFPVEIDSRLVSIEGQSYVLSVARDIAEREKAEQALKETVEKLEATLAAFPDLLFEVDRTGLIYDYHTSPENQLYAPPGEFAGKTVAQMLPADAAAVIQGALAKAELQGKHGGDIYSLDMPGGRRWYELSVSLMGKRSIPEARYLATVRDITERKKAEAALRESEQDFRKIFENAGDGMFLADLETNKLLKGNASCLKMLGLSQEEFICSVLRDLHPPEELPQIFEKIGMFMKGDKDLRMECRFKRKDGSTFTSDLSPSSVNYQGKKAILIVFQDISQRKQEAEALQESRQLFQSYFENAPYGVFIADEKGSYLQVNHAACRITGYSREELLVLSIPDMIPPEERETAGNHFRRAAETGKASGEFAFRHKNGNIRYWSVDAVKLSETRFMGFVQDITERKMIEDELKSSEAKYRLLVDNLGEGIGITDRHELFTFANHAAERIFGAGPGQLVGRAVTEFLDPAGLEVVNQQTANRRVGAENRYELAINDAGGQRKYLTVTAVPQTGEQGGFLGTFGIFWDITQRKKAEAEREKMISELKEALANIKQLKDLIPICASCKKIRNDQGYWQQVDVYLKENTESDVSHGLCRECAEKLYPEFAKKKETRHE